MATIEVKYRVDIIESERGWGQKVEDRKYFDELADAEKYVNDFNADNDKDYVPDWYMRANPPVMVPVDEIPAHDLE